MNKIFNYLNNPKVALLIILVCLITFFFVEGFISGFGNNFLAFGPTKDEVTNKPVTFMGIKLDTWTHVNIVYCIIFISSLLQTYYNNVTNINIRTYVFNISDSIIPYSKFWTYVVLLIDPFIQTTLYIIQFYATVTLQLQYILPQFIAHYITDFPFILQWLTGRKFIS